MKAAGLNGRVKPSIFVCVTPTPACEPERRQAGHRAGSQPSQRSEAQRTTSGPPSCRPGPALLAAPRPGGTVASSDTAAEAPRALPAPPRDSFQGPAPNGASSTAPADGRPVSPPCHSMADKTSATAEADAPEDDAPKGRSKKRRTRAHVIDLTDSGSASDNGAEPEKAAPKKAASKKKTASKAKALSLIHISEPTRLLSISYAVFCLKKKK